MEEGHDEAEGEEAAADAWVGVALETDRLLVLHDARHYGNVVTVPGTPASEASGTI